MNDEIDSGYIYYLCMIQSYGRQTGLKKCLEILKERRGKGWRNELGKERLHAKRMQEPHEHEGH